MITKCNTCGKTIDRQPSWLGERNFCNKQCHIKFQSKLRGKETNNWRGGPYKFNCKVCSLPCERKRNSIKPKYCSIKCAAKDQATVFNGEKNGNWRGGNDTRYLRKTAPRPRPELCEVCGMKGKKRNGITLDHNHKTGKFRGWLCSNCNTALGLVQESKQILRALIKYLEVNENPF